MKGRIPYETSQVLDRIPSFIYTSPIRFNKAVYIGALGVYIHSLNLAYKGVYYGKGLCNVYGRGYTILFSNVFLALFYAAKSGLTLAQLEN